MITPINGHLLIEPLKHKTYLPSEHGTYQEIGIVLAVPPESHFYTAVGDTVFFDSWLAAKFPKPDAEDDDDYYWLVRWQDIRAIEKPNVQNEIPE
jgi:co-chaperonin GroES (HSP10)